MNSTEWDSDKSNSLMDDRSASPRQHQAPPDASAPEEAEAVNHDSPTAAVRLDSLEASQGAAKTEGGGGSTASQKDELAALGAASIQIDDQPLTVPEALAYLQKQGFEIRGRTLQRYCKDRLHGVVCEKIKTATGQEYHVSRNSLDRFMADNPDRRTSERQAPPGGASPAVGTAKPELAMEETAEKSEQQAHATAAPGIASDISAYKDQKDQIDFLRGQIKVKDEQIATLLERDKETNLLIQGLQNMVLQLQAPKTTVHKAIVDRAGNAPEDVV